MAKILNDKDLEGVNGGTGYELLDGLANKIPTFEPADVKPEHKKNSDNDVLILKPY